MAENSPFGDEIEATLNTASVVSTCPTCGLKLAEGATICPADGTIVAGDDSMLQHIRETYEITEVVNSGGMGIVYKAKHKILQKNVAIKMLKPGHFHETALVRFQREGKIASTLSHPNVVAIHDFGVTQFGQPFMVMEFVTGASLAERIRQKGNLSIEETTRIVTQVCEALKHAHERGILHRDVKSTNIMLVDGTTAVKVVDFGIAKFIEPAGSDDMSITETGASLGSPLYMSPEQSTGKKLDGRADLYSLGCVFFECLTGTPPFVGKSAVETIMLHMNESPPSLREATLGGKFPDHLEALVARLLNKDPEKRFQTAEETLSALRELDNRNKSEPVTSKKVENRKFPVVIACLIFLLAGIATVLFIKPSVEQTPSKTSENLQPVKSAPTFNSLEERALKKYDRPASISFLMNLINTSASLIDVSGYDLRDSDLEELQRNHRLNAIRINYTNITDAGLAILGKLEKLLTISANHTMITDAGIEKIAHLPGLVTLHVSENKLTDACAVSLAKLKTLRELTVCDTLLSDKGIKRISGLKHLRSLQINRTMVTDEGVKLIVESFPDLDEFHARNNQAITSRSLKYLQGAHKLRLLTLSGCSVKPEEMRSFFESHRQVREVTNAQEKLMLDFTAP